MKAKRATQLIERVAKGESPKKLIEARGRSAVVTIELQVSSEEETDEKAVYELLHDELTNLSKYGLSEDWLVIDNVKVKQVRMSR